MNNPAVRTVAAVYESEQFEKIRKHTHGVQCCKDCHRYCNYVLELEVNRTLELVNANINDPGFVRTIQWQYEGKGVRKRTGWQT